MLQGIHRHAIFKVGGRVVGEHRGYLTPFEADITAALQAAPGNHIDIEITLDGGRDPQVDPLMGVCGLFAHFHDQDLLRP